MPIVSLRFLTTTHRRRMGALLTAFALVDQPLAAADPLPDAVAAAALQVAPGFRVDLLYTVPKEEQGSWVGLTHDPKGRLLATDQYGGLYRITLPAVSATTGTRVEPLAITLPGPTNAPAGTAPDRFIGAHGLLYAFDSLYVMVNEDTSRAGLWRLRDTNGDDQFDQATRLREMRGGGEHGPHSFALAPDGRSLYFANGNFTALPTGLEKSRPVRWDEDHLLPRLWDARGHARDLYAPGGYIARTDPDGATMELFAMGFRNTFDLAFDQNGELFTFDSDMEWDIGTPWYMPTRINHVVDAGDYGWRSGAGRWPEYYADSLPAAVDIGPGSPTGTVFGTGARFPAAYQHALYAADWTYGTLYAIHLEPDGATFRGRPEEFVSGKPLPLTDVIVNPHDGALYFAVGGRRTQSALYRVTYTGEASTAPALPPPPTAAAQLRRQLEELHAPGTPPAGIDFAWPHLANADRFIRFAARAAIERQFTSNWAERALAEPDPQAAIEALIALARVGEKRYQRPLLAALARLDFVAQPLARQHAWLRAWQLAFTRMGPPDADARTRALDQLTPLFPQNDPRLNRELVNLLVYLESPTVVAAVVPRLRDAEPAGPTAEELGGAALLSRNEHYAAAVQQAGATRPDRQQIAYAYALRHASAGWTPALRKDYFAWFARASVWQGGASFPGFLSNIRNEALARVTDAAEREHLTELSKKPLHHFVANAVAPEGPGRDYTVADAMKLFSGPLTGRNFSRGRSMLAATACTACHRFNQEGGGMGPDLTGVGNRYSVRDLLENIIEPSRVISDQYGSEQFETRSGDIVIGRLVAEEGDRLRIMTNPFTPDDHQRVRKSDIVKRQPYGISLMPPGLINALNPEEVQDLIAYLLSGGNPADPMFAPVAR